MKLSTRFSRAGEVAVKIGHAGLREIGRAPEQRDATRLARSVAAAVEAATPAAATGAATGAPSTLRLSSSAAQPRVLFVTPRSWAAHVQWEAVIGQALRLRGAAVSFVSCGGGLGICDRSNTWESPPPPCRTCSSYVSDSLSAHGFAPFELSAHWTSPAPWPELDGLGLAELFTVEHDGLPLGALVEIPVKWFLLRADLTGDPLAASTYRQFLRSARSIAEAMRRELDRAAPEVVVLCNGLFLFESIAFELCRRRSIDVVTYERGLIKETLIFRRNAAACLMDLTPYWPEWERATLTTSESAELDEYLDERRHCRRTIDRYWDDAVFDAAPRTDRRTQITLLPNLTWDSAVIGQSAAYDGIEPWITDTIRALGARDDCELTIRVHPAETKLPGKQTREPVQEVISRHFPQLPANVTVVGSEDPRSTYPILEASDLVLVFSSTTGLEASLLGKPVIVAGQTHYRGKGFTVDATDPDDYLARLAELTADPGSFSPDIERARRYAFLLFFRAPVHCPGAEEHVLGLARLTALDASQLAPGADASIDRICNGILEGTDFGPPPPAHRSDS